VVAKKTNHDRTRLLKLDRMRARGFDHDERGCEIARWRQRARLVANLLVNVYKGS